MCEEEILKNHHNTSINVGSTTGIWIHLPHQYRSLLRVSFPKDGLSQKQACWYSPLCVTEVAAAQGRHQQTAILVPELNHSGVNCGDGLNREDNECCTLERKKTHGLDMKTVQTWLIKRGFFL